MKRKARTKKKRQQVRKKKKEKFKKQRQNGRKKRLSWKIKRNMKEMLLMRLLEHVSIKKKDGQKEN